MSGIDVSDKLGRLDDLIRKRVQEGIEQSDMKGRITELEGTQCKGESCPNRIKASELEKQLAEKPKKEIVHHKIPPWGENCPDCDFENPYPVPKERIKSDEKCTECGSPVLPGWSTCADCHEAL